MIRDYNKGHVPNPWPLFGGSMGKFHSAALGKARIRFRVGQSGHVPNPWSLICG